MVVKLFLKIAVITSISIIDLFVKVFFVIIKLLLQILIIIIPRFINQLFITNYMINSIL